MSGESPDHDSRDLDYWFHDDVNGHQTKAIPMGNGCLGKSVAHLNQQMMMMLKFHLLNWPLIYPS